MTDLKIGCRYRLTIFFHDFQTVIVWAIGASTALVENSIGYFQWVPKNRLEPLND